MLATEQTTLSQKHLSDLFWLMLGLGLFYAIWIGSHALFTPDEGRYSEVAREMIATGDYITPRLNGIAFLDKPILYYWLQASAIHIFGLKEAALRFWPAFIGILGALCTYLGGCILFNRRTGILASLIVATCPLYYGAAHYANLDLEVAVFVSNALLFFIIGMQYQPGKIRTAALLLAYVFAALAFLTKGLIGIVFPALIIGGWILFLNRWKILSQMYLRSGLILFFLLITPWFVAVSKANPEFLHFFFVTQQVSRFLTHGDYNSKAAIWFYLPVVLAGIFPWSIFVFQALTKNIKQVMQNKEVSAHQAFLLIWVFLIFIFFSIPTSKTAGYILPIFPAIALLIAHYIDIQWDKLTKNIILAFSLICLAVGIGLILVPYIKALEITPDLIPYLHSAAGLFLGSGILSLFFRKKYNTFYFFITVLVTALSFLLLIIASTQAINQRSIKPLAQELNHRLKPGDEVVTYYKFYYDLPIYTGKRITIVADWQAADIIHNDNWVRELWFGMPFQDTHAWLINQDEFWKRWNSTNRLYVITELGYYEDMKKSKKENVYKVAQYKNTVLLSNKNPLLT